MATKLECPKCGQHLEAEETIEELAGVEITCPSCNGSFVVSAEDEAAAPPPESATKRTPRNTPEKPSRKKHFPRPSLALILGICFLGSLVGNGVLTWRLATNSAKPESSSSGSTLSSARSQAAPRSRSSSLPETYRIEVTVWADTKFGSPKYPAQYDLYKNGEKVRTEVDNSSYVEFKNVEVEKYDKLSAKVGWRNAFGAVLRTDKSDEKTVYGSSDVSIHTDQFKC